MTRSGGNSPAMRSCVTDLKQLSVIHLVFSLTASRFCHFPLFRVCVYFITAAAHNVRGAGGDQGPGLM